MIPSIWLTIQINIRHLFAQSGMVQLFYLMGPYKVLLHRGRMDIGAIQ